MAIDDGGECYVRLFLLCNAI